MRTFVRKVEEAIASGDKAAAAAALKAAQPEIMRAASKGVVHKNTASRKVSRLPPGEGARRLNRRSRPDRARPLRPGFLVGG